MKHFLIRALVFFVLILMATFFSWVFYDPNHPGRLGDISALFYFAAIIPISIILLLLDFYRLHKKGAKQLSKLTLFFIFLLILILFFLLKIFVIG